MAYLIRESNQNDNNIIHDFNKELESHGFNFSLPVPISKNLNTNNFILKNSFILIENKIAVRAGYTLKCQWFKVNDTLLRIGYYYQPVSAGLFNKKYNICGVMLLNDAQKKYPNLFSLGMGGYSEPLPKLLKSLNWKLQKVPFFFKVFNPNSFLKNMRYFKNTKLESFFIMLMMYSGLGWLFIKFIFQVSSLFNFRLKKEHHLTVKEIEIFDQDLDLVWENSKQYNSFAAVRNCEYLKILYSDKRFIKLKFVDNNKIVGWSISLCTKLDDHKYFGHMRLGSIVDCLSLKGYEKSIVCLTAKLLKYKEADLIVSNQSHIFWKNAFKINSFINGPSNYIFALSKILSDKLMDDKKLKDYIHLTRGDGDGPINL
jgi:hypothetical protein|tara:strand:- start:39 stop:1151 length:1113 start_codon:yes stop_codon:yes gene_type:complete